MRRSEKTLLAVFIAMLLVWQGSGVVYRAMIEPIDQQQAKLDELEETIGDKQDQQLELMRVKKLLDERISRSLPPDPLTAQRLYQSWLTDLAQDSGFEELRVVPDRVTNKSDSVVGVLVSIQAEARLDQLCLFLERFYRTDLLQRLTTLSLDSQHNRTNPPLRITIIAEGLSMQGAASRQQLFPTGRLAEAVDARSTTLRIDDAGVIPKRGEFLLRSGSEYARVKQVIGQKLVVDRGVDGSLPAQHPPGEALEFLPLVAGYDLQAMTRYRSLVARNPFARPSPKVVVKQAAVPVEEVVPEIDAAEFTYFVGTFMEGEEQEVWFFDRLNNERVIVAAGSRFSIAGVTGVVESIGSDFVLLEHANVRWRLNLGKTLRAMERVPVEAPPSESGPDEGESR